VNTQKAQQFGSDLIHDLRARGLLPVVILLAAGMLVAPMLINRGGSDAEAPPPPPIPGTGEASLQNEPAVLTYNPSVRDYRERLDKLQEKDPFIQQFSQPAATESAAAETAGATTTPTDAPTGSGGGGTGGTGDETVDSNKGDVTPNEPGFFYFYRETDIKIGEASQPLKQKNRVPELSFLPSEKVPLLVYMGATRNAKHAIFLVSDEVTVTEGQDRCSPSPEDCDALRLQEDDEVTMVNAVDAKTYKMKVLDVRLVRSTKPPAK
jgi:hypothetical protein